MNQKKLSSRAYTLIKSAISAAVLPVFLIYIIVDKPDYKIMSGLSKVIVPAAQWIGDIASWPIHAVGNATSGIRELSNLRSENEELRARLDDALAKKTECDVIISENQRLSRELDIVKKTPQKSVVANITYNNEAFHHSTFFINKGSKSGIENGMAVVSFDGALVGVVSDVGENFSKARSLADGKSNIPVRIVGSEVYGFLQGNGSKTPAIGFFSDPEFQPTAGLKLITSGIRGVLPDGIYVGELTSNDDVRVLLPTNVSSVMVLKFNNQEKYK